MGNDFKIKKGFISEDDSMVDGTLSVKTININTVPVNDNTLTQILGRDSTTGEIRYRDASSIIFVPLVTITTANLVVDTNTQNFVAITAQAQALIIAAPTGTPTEGQKLIIRIKDDGTARAITYNAVFRAIGLTLPTTTVASKTLYLGFAYNTTDTKWDAIALKQEA